MSTTEPAHCTCHNEFGISHELCCGHDEGRDPDCPFHGDGSGPYGRDRNNDV